MSPLQVPHHPSPPATRNFIHLAVCELKFPTLLEFGEDRPAALQRSIKSLFPLYERVDSVSIGPSPAPNEYKHLFRTKDLKSTVAFKSDAIAVETSSYSSWEGFLEWVDLLIDKSRDLIDSPFFTRVGLRYINKVPVQKAFARDYVNGLLVGPLIGSQLGVVSQTLQEIRGTTSRGGYTLRHGFADGAREPIEYYIDMDMYQSNVEVESTRALVTGFHDDAYDLFVWALGPKSVASLQSR